MISLSIRAKQWSKDCPTGNFYVKLIKMTKKDVPHDPFNIFKESFPEENEITVLEEDHLIPVEHLKDTIREYEKKYEFDSKYTDEDFELLYYKYHKFVKSEVAESIPEDIMINFGQFDGMKLKDAFLKKSTYFIWLSNINSWKFLNQVLKPRKDDLKALIYYCNLEKEILSPREIYVGG